MLAHESAAELPIIRLADGFPSMLAMESVAELPMVIS